MPCMSSPEPEYKEELKRLGVAGFRPGQKAAVDRIVVGKNTLVLMPTGAGKSLCYQLPALVLAGTALIVSPLLALMREQVEGIVEKGIPAARWDSTQSPEEREALRSRLIAGQEKMLYISPESLRSREMEEVLGLVDWSFLVIDEAHCLSEWGQRFRPEYLQLPAVARRLGRPVLALTATATACVAEELATVFEIEAEDIVRLPLRKKNICREVIPVTAADKDRALAEYLERPGHLPALVYVNRREDAETVAAMLSRCGIRARAYHAGMTAESRAALHGEYMADGVPVLVATTAFGMGVDKSNVRSVVHYQVPSGLEGYLQESGRGGRDGEAAWSLILADADDLLPLQNRFRAILPGRNALDSFLRSLLPAGMTGIRCFSEWDAQALYDLDETVLGRILVYLEDEGYVHWLGSGRKKWKLRPLVSAGQLCAGRSAEERAWTEWLLEHREFTLDEVVEQWKWEYEEALEHLQELEASGEWRVMATHRVRLLKNGRSVESFSRLAADLYSLFDRRMEGDLERLSGVWDFMQAGECYNRQLERYFGETPSESCELCSFCRFGRVALGEPSSEPVFTIEDMAFLRELADCKMPALGTPRRLARFVAGFLSPSASRARLWKLPQYGAYRNYSLESLELYAASVM